MTALVCARRIRVRGVVQGVGFRPHVYRLAQAHGIAGWIVNDGDGVEIHAEGAEPAILGFVRALTDHVPPAAAIADVHVVDARVESSGRFAIRASAVAARPTARISPDLPVCDACLHELFDPADRRAGYPYINCTDCGPRFSIVEALPYDRARTTMAPWALCPACAREYADPLDRRFHAQPVACPSCGPQYRLLPLSAAPDAGGRPTAHGPAAVAEAARLLSAGAVVGIKGIGGYHLACDASNPLAVAALRDRKFRKEQAFAIMARDEAAARGTCALSPEAEALLRSAARPIVLAPRRIDLPGVAPGNADLGLMLPYAPVHHLLFAHGAPDRLVMTSGNRSSEPIEYRDADACERLHGLADALLAGERPIARRLDDSIVRAGALGPVVLRRSRGMAPAAIARLASARPVLALGGDLKNTVTLVVGGQAYTGPHIGNLEHYEARLAFQESIRDLMAIYEVPWRDVLVVHDRHPDYVSTRHAATLSAGAVVAVQHHRAHVASVVAEHGALDCPVVGAALDGTGYGDDGTIWGGEIFVGSVRDGLARAAHLRAAVLPGGDAAAQHPVQAAAGFLGALDGLPDLAAPPFAFPDRYRQARALAQRQVRAFTTTSAGRLFDVVAALTGFTRPITFEGQAAMWLEHLARQGDTEAAYPMPFDGCELDWRPTLAAVVRDRAAGVEPARIARAFHRGFARALAAALSAILDRHRIDTAVLSGGVAQNDLLLADLRDALTRPHTRLLINHAVPANDGGLSLGQAALVCAPPDA